MSWMDFARRMPITRNFTPGRMDFLPKGVALHVTDGVKGQLPNLGGVFSTFNAEGARRSAHFCVSKEGDIAQYVSLRDVAWGVGGDSKSNDDEHWISVENIALPGQLLTFAQIAGVALIYSWLNRNLAVPLQLADTRDDNGLGYHSMFQRGHPGCPGPGVITQRADVLHLIEKLQTMVLHPGF